MAPSSPMLSGALQNQALRDASYASPMSPYQQPMAPSSPMLSGALQNQALMDASFVSPMSPYQQPMAPSSPMLSGALQNQALRDASFVSPMSPYQQPMAPSSPMLSGALQNQALRDASFVSPMSPYQQPMAPSSPMLSGALQNQALMNASFVSPMSPYQQPMAPSSPMLSGALQNQAIRGASFASPLQRPISPYASVPSSPMLSGAMRHGQALRGVSSYQISGMQSPYGPTVIGPYAKEPKPSRQLLNNPYLQRSLVHSCPTERIIIDPTEACFHTILDLPRCRTQLFATPHNALPRGVSRIPMSCVIQTWAKNRPLQIPLACITVRLLILSGDHPTPNIPPNLSNSPARADGMRRHQVQVSRRFPSHTSHPQAQLFRRALLTSSYVTSSYRVPNRPLYGEDNHTQWSPLRATFWPLARMLEVGGEGGEDVWAAERLPAHGDTSESVYVVNVPRMRGILRRLHPTTLRADGAPETRERAPEREKMPGEKLV
uniref:Uncharacterized protein n=1 Tax=Knipowitschia caucasica TaxID=637954 RepID=A0AAV2LPA6_KNICA